jgi:hypothetical protein
VGISPLDMLSIDTWIFSQVEALQDSIVFSATMREQFTLAWEKVKVSFHM